MKTLGDFIHQGRLTKGLTMSKLASMTGLSLMYISELENERKIPGRGDALEKIAQCLNLEVNELRNAAALSKVKSLMSSKTKSSAGKFALARRIMLSNLGDDQIDQIAKILKEEKEES